MDVDRIVDEAAAGVLPFESWERLDGESGAAFAAFCAFRDFGLERNIRKTVDSVETDGAMRGKRYRVWRNWAVRFQWAKRAADYDGYLEKLKQAELRKTIEAQGEKHREATGKMLGVLIKKLDLMNPADLGNNAVPVWADTAIKLDREASQCAEVSASRKSGQTEFNFSPDFEGV